MAELRYEVHNLKGRVPLSGDEAARSLAKKDGLLNAKLRRIEAIRTEAEERITAALGTDDSMDAVSRRLEQLMTALVLTRREATGRINAAQTAMLDGLEGQAQHLQAIRAAARSAISAIKSAETVEAVDAVTVEWPA